MANLDGFRYILFKLCVPLRCCLADFLRAEVCLHPSEGQPPCQHAPVFYPSEPLNMIRPAHSRICQLFVVLVTIFAGPVSPSALAQEGCCFEPAYRLQCATVMEPQTVKRFRIGYETEYVSEDVTSYRQVLKTRTEMREYKVAKPVVETSYREERYTVWKPITETSYRDESYTQTRYVTETAEREEQVTTYRPVVETSYVQKQYTVQRPVVETQYRDQQYTVQRPVVETQYRTQQYTSMRPVTTMQNQTVDAGGYAATQVVTPGRTSYGLQYVGGTSATPGPFGVFARMNGGYYWTPQNAPATVQTQYSYRPNYITQQVAQTSYVPQVQQVQVPVQVQRMQTEVVTQRVPVQVQRMQTETVTQNVPVQTTRMVATTEVRKTPYTVQRPVTETLTRKVPVQKQRWISEVKVRKVPVQTTRLVYETRKEPVQVKYYEREAVVRKVLRPVTRQTCVPYTETIMVPRQVVQRTPLSYYDPFSPAIRSGYSSFSVPVVTDELEAPDADAADSDMDDSGQSVLQPPRSASDAPETHLHKVETGAPEHAGDHGDHESTADEADDDGVDTGDAEELPAPSLDNAEPELNASEAGWKIRWNPIYAREA